MAVLSVRVCGLGEDWVCGIGSRACVARAIGLGFGVRDWAPGLCCGVVLGLCCGMVDFVGDIECGD